MKEVVNKFLLVGGKFTPEVYLKQPGFTYAACVLLKKKTKKGSKNLCRQEIPTLFKEMSLIKLVFSMIWVRQIKRLSKKNSIRQIFER